MTTPDHTTAIRPATGRLPNAFRRSTGKTQVSLRAPALELSNVPLGGTGKVPTARESPGAEGPSSSYGITASPENLQRDSA